MAEIAGRLFQYGNGLIAFKSGQNKLKTLVLIGGLQDNILSLPYTSALKKYCDQRNICLVIPQLRSMPYFKITTVDKDVEDIASLLDTIEGDVALMGHSTGCNDIILYLKENNKKKIHCGILQAPVSDTEAESAIVIKSRMLLIEDFDKSKKFIEFDNGELWCKERYTSLYSKYGKEDLFSTYLEDDAFIKCGEKVPLLSIISGNDEFCQEPPIEKFKLMGEVYVIKNADHSISCPDLYEEFVSEVDKFFIKTQFVANE